MFWGARSNARFLICENSTANFFSAERNPIIKTRHPFAYLKSNFSLGLIVFLVALLLCLGISPTSGAPLFLGTVSGIIDGIFVGVLSSFHVSVTGPADGLSAIVLSAITDFGSYEIFLSAVVMAELFQLDFGFFKAGSISNYFPTNVIERVLAGIGIIIFLNKAAIKNTLNNIPEDSTVVIDASDTVYITHDVLDLICEFQQICALEVGIQVKLVGFKREYNLEDI